MKIKVEAIVEAERICDDEGYRIARNQGFWPSFNSGDMFVKAEHVTEVPDPIKRGTMVWAWENSWAESSAVVMFYARSAVGGHLVAEAMGMDAVTVVYPNVRPVTVDDLQVGKA